jgi:hypothetical protein
MTLSFKAKTPPFPVTIMFMMVLLIPFYLFAQQTQPVDPSTTQTLTNKAPQTRLIDSWIYIDHFEVRHELLIPFPLLESIIAVPRENKNWLEIVEQKATQEDILDLIELQSPLEIDGIEVSPISRKLVFFKKQISSITADPPPERLPISDIYLGIIYGYSTKGTPNRIGMTWGTFSPLVTTIRSTVYAFAETNQQTVTENNNHINWISPGLPPLPPIRALKANPSASVSQQEADVIFSSLHRNLYRAFDYRDESEIYDSLAKSVSGELLATIYLQIKQGLTIEAEGGASTRVEEIIIQSGEMKPQRKGATLGFDYLAEWTVRGKVEHWGHVHERINLYSAQFSINIIEEAWKLTAMRVQNQERLENSLTKRNAGEQGS